MQKKSKCIELLNKAITLEMISLNQYMYFHIYCADRGYDTLASLFKKSAIREMIHCEDFAERVLFLGDTPNMDVNLHLNYTTSVKEMFALAMELENDSITKYNHWAMLCGQEEDASTKRLFERVIEEEEEHFGNFDNIHSDVKKYGDEYMVLQSVKHSKNITNHSKAD